MVVQICRLSTGQRQRDGEFDISLGYTCDKVMLKVMVFNKQFSYIYCSQCLGCYHSRSVILKERNISKGFFILSQVCLYVCWCVQALVRQSTCVEVGPPWGVGWTSLRAWFFDLVWDRVSLSVAQCCICLPGQLTRELLGILLSLPPILP